MVRWSLLPVNDEPYHRTSRAFYVWSPNNNNLTILIKMENFCLNIDIIFTQSFGDNDLVFTKKNKKHTHRHTCKKKSFFSKTNWFYEKGPHDFSKWHRSCSPRTSEYRKKPHALKYKCIYNAITFIVN